MKFKPTKMMIVIIVTVMTHQVEMSHKKLIIAYKTWNKTTII